MEELKKDQLFREKWTDRVNRYFNEKKRIQRERPKDKTESKKLIEKAAVDYVKKVYEERWGYIVRSRENDKTAWHLEAFKKKERLKLLVKGLGLREFAVHLTPQEYDAIRENPKSIRYCLVVNAQQ